MKVCLTFRLLCLCIVPGVSIFSNSISLHSSIMLGTDDIRLSTYKKAYIHFIPKIWVGAQTYSMRDPILPPLDQPLGFTASLYTLPHLWPWHHMGMVISFSFQEFLYWLITLVLTEKNIISFFCDSHECAKLWIC